MITAIAEANNDSSSTSGKEVSVVIWIRIIIFKIPISEIINNKNFHWNCATLSDDIKTIFLSDKNKMTMKIQKYNKTTRIKYFRFDENISWKWKFLWVEKKNARIKIKIIVDVKNKSFNNLMTNVEVGMKGLERIQCYVICVLVILDEIWCLWLKCLQ